MNNIIVITRDVEGKEEVEKTISVNPYQYKWIDFYEALDSYRDYCFECGRIENINFSKGADYFGPAAVKTFKEWLDDPELS